MSLFKKILRAAVTSFAPAREEIEAQARAAAAKATPEVKAAIAVLESSVKQGASDALAMAGSAAAPLVEVAGDVVEEAVLQLLRTYIGPVAPIVTPALHDGVNRIQRSLIQRIDAAVLRFQAELAAKA